MEYSKEQIEDIKEREKKGIEALKELKLSPGAYLSLDNLRVPGKDVFGVIVQPYLQDTKYVKKADEPKVVDAEIVSPIQADDINPKN